MVASFEEAKYHEMPARFFREVVRRTVFATDNESSRYALGGVLVELTTADQITAVATDGRRLARQEGPAKSVGGHQTGDRTTIIPTRAMQLIERALADNDENIQLSTRDNDILLKSGRTTIYSRLVEGRFPKWQDVFPRRESNVRVELTVGPFYAAIRQAAIVTSEERRGVDFTFGGGKVVLAAHGAEYGESHVELPIAYDGAEVIIALDPRYLVDFLRVLDAEQTVTVELRDGESAAVLFHPGRLRLRHHAIGARFAMTRPMSKGPQPIGNILPELMARHGFARLQSAAQYDAAWREAAGPLAAQYTRAWRATARQIGSGCGQFDLDAGIDLPKTRAIESAVRLLPEQGIEDLRFRVGTID